MNRAFHWIFLSSLAASAVTQWRNQTVLCRDLPCGPSTMTMACCCKDLKWCGHNEPRGRAAAARGGQQNTGLILVLGDPARAAARWGPGDTRAELEKKHHSPWASSLCCSSWKWGNVFGVWNRLTKWLFLCSQKLWGVALLHIAVFVNVRGF